MGSIIVVAGEWRQGHLGLSFLGGFGLHFPTGSPLKEGEIDSKLTFIRGCSRYGVSTTATALSHADVVSR